MNELIDDIILNDKSLVGVHSPDPLRFAFSRKSSAHAGGDSQPINPDQVQSSLRSVLLSKPEKPKQNRCLYIHIPFCRVRCTYCNFFQYASSERLMEQYFRVLIEEIKWKSTFDWAVAEPFQAVYVGGGTPTDLSSQQLLLLGKAIRQYFPLTSDCEITLEGRVNHFLDDKFESALEGGFNRFSFGVQSFETVVRRAAKRLDDKEVVLKRLEKMTSYNSATIVIDLLYGLPMQSLAVWQSDLRLYLESGVDGVDLYQLIEMQGLPMERMVQQGKLPYPADTQMKATMFEMGVKFMAKHHQTRLSVNHWASSNRERSIYNSLAKTSAEILPLGLGAGGSVNGIQMMNVRDMDNYCAAIKSKQFPVGMAFYLSPQHQLHSVIKAGFDRGVLNKFSFEKIGQSAVFEQARPLFEAWQKNGLVTLSEQYVSLTLAGEFWAVNLVQILISITQRAPLQKRVA